MKYKIIFSLFFTLFIQSTFTYEPLLVVAIMVKDEEAVIQATLQPYLDYDPQGNQIAYFVFDTGIERWSPTMQKSDDLFSRYTLMGVAAWYVGSYDLGTQALYKALEIQPDNPVLHTDLQFYLNRNP